MKIFLLMILTIIALKPAFAVQNCDITENQKKEAISAGEQFLFNAIKPALNRIGILTNLPSKIKINIVGNHFGSFYFDSMIFTVDSGSPIRALFLEGENQQDSRFYVQPIYDAAGNYLRCDVVISDYSKLYSVYNIETGKKLDIDEILLPTDAFYHFGPNN